MKGLETEKEDKTLYPEFRDARRVSNASTAMVNQPEDSTPHHLARLASQVLFQSPENQCFPSINIYVNTIDTHQTFKVNALLDSGATGLYVDRNWIEKNDIKTTPLQFPVHAYNADGSPNHSTQEVELRFAIQGHITKGWFHVVNLNKKAIIIGMSWLRTHNPVIDWESGKL